MVTPSKTVLLGELQALCAKFNSYAYLFKVSGNTELEAFCNQVVSNCKARYDAIAVAVFPA